MQTLKSMLDNIRNLSVTVMGLGLNGGGLAAASFFAERGAKVTVTDLKSAEELEPSVKKLSGFSNIRFVLGEHRIEDFKNADLVIKNPGVKREGNIYLQNARRIETDISVFLSLSHAPLLAVTGSKGKSSTASALHYGLKALGYNAFLGGNITVSPLTFLEQTGSTTPVVLELSSWQLADLKNADFFKPQIAIITPIMSDHLNWYGTMEKYVADKKIIYKNMDKDCRLICSYGDRWGNEFAAESAARIYRYSEQALPEDIEGAFFTDGVNGFCRVGGKCVHVLNEKSRVPGIKLKQNVLNAALALMLYGAHAEKLSEVMNGYAGIEHRMEFFYESNGVEFYNDSAATIPEAAEAALRAFSSPPVLICGGTNKKLDFTPLADRAYRAKSIYLLRGSGTDLLIDLLKERGIAYYGPFDGFDPLLAQLKSRLEKGDKVVLSPGAASFELFTNEFYRGNQFKQKVREMM
ncbi:UDP-N-acetylmuramoyl-L-alanine--D-glutamate ligase [Treponema maltophilum]|uniref:UDP-N-acetylmuramoyl-L-alanine--D-glutamate ligase n=1 Tax=Treponema maltophilum TaxID=51160 RepID=UPI003D93C872